MQRTPHLFGEGVGAVRKAFETWAHPLKRNGKSEKTRPPMSNFAQTLKSHLVILATSIGVGIPRRCDETMGFGH
jgi:hypothetical protein